MSYNLITIAHLITELNMGGAEQMLHKLVSRMDKDRFKCVVISMTDKGPIGERMAADGIPVFELGMKQGRPGLRGFSKLFYFLKNEEVDILQTWLYHADLLGLITGRFAGIERIVWGVRCSNMHLRNYRPLTALTVRSGALLSPLVNAIIVNSIKGKDVHVRRGYHSERMVFIPNGFDTDRFCPDESAKDMLREDLGISKDAVLIGLVARFDPMKDQKTFLKAASIVAKKNNTAHFILIGKGMVPQNRDLEPFINHDLKGKVHLLGVKDDTPKLTAALDIACSSSAFGEGFSNTIGEAMSCGVPCVVTDVGDSAYIVGDTGMIVPPKDPEALADALLKLLNERKDKRKAIGDNARQRVLDNFELGKIVRRFEDFYEKLMETDH